MRDFFDGLAPNWDQQMWDAMLDTSLLFWILMTFGIVLVLLAIYAIFEAMLRIRWEKGGDGDKARRRTATLLTFVALLVLIYVGTGWAPTARDVLSWTSRTLARLLPNTVIVIDPNAGVSISRVDSEEIAQIATVVPAIATSTQQPRTEPTETVQCAGLTEFPNMPGVFGNQAAQIAAQGQEDWHLHFSSPTTVIVCFSSDADLEERNAANGVNRLLIGKNMVIGQPMELSNIPAGYYIITK